LKIQFLSRRKNDVSLLKTICYLNSRLHKRLNFQCLTPAFFADPVRADSQQRQKAGEK